MMTEPYETIWTQKLKDEVTLRYTDLKDKKVKMISSTESKKSVENLMRKLRDSQSQ